MSEQEIHDICEELFIKEYTINTDCSIDVEARMGEKTSDHTFLTAQFDL